MTDDANDYINVLDYIHKVTSSDFLCRYTSESKERKRVATNDARAKRLKQPENVSPRYQPKYPFINIQFRCVVL